MVRLRASVTVSDLPFRVVGRRDMVAHRVDRRHGAIEGVKNRGGDPAHWVLHRDQVAIRIVAVDRDERQRRGGRRETIHAVIRISCRTRGLAGGSRLLVDFQIAIAVVYKCRAIVKCICRSGLAVHRVKAIGRRVPPLVGHLDRVSLGIVRGEHGRIVGSRSS